MTEDDSETKYGKKTNESCGGAVMQWLAQETFDWMVGKFESQWFKAR